MTRSNTLILEPTDSEIEKTFHSLRKLVKEKITTIKEEPMENQAKPRAAAGAVAAANRSLMEYGTPSLIGTTSCIKKPTI